METLYGINLIPPDDAERVAALQHYQILNSHREKAFDSICELACELFSCPMSHISFLSADKEFVKAGVGIGDITEVDRGLGFCAVAVLHGKVLVVEDTHLHELFANHPFVTGELMIRFYAGAPIITPDGYIIGTLCLLDTQPRTLTEKEHQVLQKLAQVVMEQTELRYHNLNLLHQKDEFIAIASHEMRTPLTSLRAAVEVLVQQQKAGKPDKDGRLTAQVHRSTQKLAHLVNDLFDASRLSERRFALNKKVFDLSGLVNNCCGFAESTGKHQLIVKGEPGIELTGDQEKIEQVLTNLVENAMKYAPDTPTVTLTIETLPGNVKISVADQGQGIPRELLPHIFRKFFRPESSHSQTGLGLGLYICSEIVKAHGGEIGVESEPGQGATFWFTLPV